MVLVGCIFKIKKKEKTVTSLFVDHWPSLKVSLLESGGQSSAWDAGPSGKQRQSPFLQSTWAMLVFADTVFIRYEVIRVK